MSSSSSSNLGEGPSEDVPGTPEANVPKPPQEGSLDVTRDYEGTRIGLDADFGSLPKELLENSLSGTEQMIGKYVLRGELGQGGMGVVLKALDPDLNRVVAIKFLNRHLLQSAIARRRFQREARAVAAISHPNVLTIHSVEEQNGVPFLVMEYVAGQSLKEYIQTKGKLEAVEVIRLSTQIAQGLAAAHAQGVIHRDIKPGNVMLHDGATRVRLMDFGLARVAFDNAELTSHDHTVGTPAYMAPEQIRGDAVDARADLFSLGCLMYAMLTGHSPFHGRTPAETVHRITSSEPPLLSDFDSSVPPVLADIIQRLLCKDPHGRYQSAFELADVLKRLLQQLNQTPTDEMDEFLHSRGVARTKLGSNRPNQAAQRWLAGIFLVAVAIGLGAVGRNWFTNGEPQPPIHGANRFNPSPTGNPSNAQSVGAQKSASQELLTQISVSRNGTARCATLSEALALAAKDCTITVLDEGPYEEAIEITGERLQGLSLIASKPAQWRLPSSKRGAVLAIHDVSNVTVRGFVLETSDRRDQAVLLSGALNNIVFDTVRFQQTAKSGGTPLVEALFKAGQDAQDLQPVTFRGCNFAADGLSIHWSGGDTGAWPLHLENNHFTGATTLISLGHSCRQIRIVGNVFVGGINAININFKSWPADAQVEILNNTFVKPRFWLGFVTSTAFAPQDSAAVPMKNKASRVMNNLILGGERVQGNDGQITQALTEWQFAANCWEREASTRENAGWSGRLSELKDSVGLRNRDDPHDPNYLVPEENSPLLSEGVGGDLPSYIGARGRRENARSL